MNGIKFIDYVFLLLLIIVSVCIISEYYSKHKKKICHFYLSIHMINLLLITLKPKT